MGGAAEGGTDLGAAGATGAGGASFAEAGVAGAGLGETGAGGADGRALGAALGVGAGFGFVATGGGGTAGFLAGTAGLPVPTRWAASFDALAACAGATGAGASLPGVGWAPAAGIGRTGVAGSGTVCAGATAVKKK